MGSSFANTEYKVNFNPAAANDLYESSATKKSHKSVTAKNSVMNGGDQERQTNTMEVIAENDSATEEKNDPCKRCSTVRFAEASIEEEEEKIEEAIDEIL